MEQKKNQTNKNNRKKRMTLVLVVFALVGSTLAWKDFSQHKTNTVMGKGKGSTISPSDVVLVDEFDPKEAEKWSIDNPTINKKVKVVNEGSDLVFVRIKLGEYLEFASVPGGEDISNLRYMLDKDGNFISVNVSEDDTNEKIIEKMNTKLKGMYEQKIIGTLKADDIAEESDKRVENVKRVHIIEDKAYIATRKDDPNGQYGKHIVRESVSKEEVDLNKPADPDKYSELVIVGANNGKRPPASDGQTIPDDIFEYYEIIKHDDKNKASREYIKLGFNEDFYQAGIEHDENINDEGQTGKWIHDGEYIYYSRGLTQKGSANAETPYLLNNLQLIKDPKTGFYYQLHMNLEAVTYDELEEFDAPPSLQNLYDEQYKNWKNDKKLAFVDGDTIPELECKKYDMLRRSNVKLQNKAGKDLEFKLLFKDGDYALIQLNDFIRKDDDVDDLYDFSKTLGEGKKYDDTPAKEIVDRWYKENFEGTSLDYIRIMSVNMDKSKRSEEIKKINVETENTEPWTVSSSYFHRPVQDIKNEDAYYDNNVKGFIVSYDDMYPARYIANGARYDKEAQYDIGSQDVMDNFTECEMAFFIIDKGWPWDQWLSPRGFEEGESGAFYASYPRKLETNYLRPAFWVYLGD